MRPYTWAHYQVRVEALVKESTDDDRSKIVSALAKHAKLIEKLSGGSTAKATMLK